MITFDGSAYIQVPIVPASLGANDPVFLRRQIHTVNNEQFSYYGQ